MKNQLKNIQLKLEHENNPSKKIEYIIRIARLYQFCNYNKMLQHSLTALEIANELNSKSLIAKSSMTIAASYLGLLDNSNALDYYIQALANVNKDDYSTISYSYTGIGVIYHRANMYTLSSNFHHKALYIANKAGLHNEKIACLNNISNIFMSYNSLNISINFLSEAYNISCEFSTPLKRLIILSNLITANLDSLNSTESERLLLIADELIETPELIMFLGLFQVLWGRYHYLVGSIETALIKFDLGFDILKEENQYLPYLSSCKIYADILSKLNKEKKAKQIYFDAFIYIEKHNIPEVYPQVFGDASVFFKYQDEKELSTEFLQKHYYYNSILVKKINETRKIIETKYNDINN